jgi:hypothetical protein
LYRNSGYFFSEVQKQKRVSDLYSQKSEDRRWISVSDYCFLVFKFGFRRKKPVALWLTVENMAREFESKKGRYSWNLE